MSDKLQKLLIVFAGVVMVGVSYVLWSPGTFGLCEGEVRMVTHELFGEVERCDLALSTVGTKSMLLYFGIITALSAVASFFLPAGAFTFFRNWLLGTLLAGFAFFFLMPEPSKMIGDPTPSITDRAEIGAELLILLSIVGFVWAYIRKEKYSKWLPILFVVTILFVYFFLLHDIDIIPGRVF